MKNSLYTVLVILATVITTNGQWNTNGATVHTNDASANVGIGTDTALPGVNNKGLHISHGSHSMLMLGQPTSGFGGIVQTSDDRHRVFIGANLYDDQSLSWKNFQSGKGGAGISILADNGNWGTNINFYTSNNDNQLTSRMVIDGVGNVGIGKITPEFRLDLVSNSQVAIGRTYVDNPIDADNDYTRSNFGSNVYWDASTNYWNINPIGNNDFSAVIHPNGDGLAFITALSDGNFPKSLTHGQFMAYERMRIRANGNVGIGTPSPIAQLHLASNQDHELRISRANGMYGFRIRRNATGGWIHFQNTDDNDLPGTRIMMAEGGGAWQNLILNPNGGNVGIGTGTDVLGYKLQVNSMAASNFRLVSNGSTPSYPSIDIFDATHGTEFVLSPSAGKVDLFTYTGHHLAFGTANTERMRILSNGSVGIGTENPGTFKLAVNGKIWTQEVNVAMTNPGPDYVFEEDYELLSLAEVEAYIKQNRHLPEVPSAKQMDEDGLNLKEMNLILLKKVEELTLHLIEMKKKNEKQNLVINQLQEERSAYRKASEKKIDDLASLLGELEMQVKQLNSKK